MQPDGQQTTTVYYKAGCFGRGGDKTSHETTVCWRVRKFYTRMDRKVANQFTDPLAISASFGLKQNLNQFRTNGPAYGVRILVSKSFLC